MDNHDKNGPQSDNRKVTFQEEAQFTHLSDFDASRYKPLGQFESGLDYSSSHNFSSPFSYNTTRNVRERELSPLEKYNSGERRSSTGGVIGLYLVTAVCYVLLILAAPISLWFCLKKVNHSDKMVLFRMGRLLKSRGPGYTVVFPFVDSHTMVTTNPRAFNVPPRKVITSDRAEVELGAELYYQVANAEVSVLAYQDLNTSLRLTAQACLAKHVSAHSLSELDTGKTSINLDLKMEMNQRLQKYGVVVTRFELSPVKILREIACKEEFPVEQIMDIVKDVFFGGSGGGGTSKVDLARLFGMGAAAAPGPSGDAAPVDPSQGASGHPVVGGPAGDTLSGLQSDVHGTAPTIPGSSSLEGAVGGLPVSSSLEGAIGGLPVSSSLEGAVGGLSASSPPGGSTSPPPIRLEDLMNVVSKTLNAELCAEVDAVYQFEVLDVTGAVEIFYLDAKNGPGSVGRGVPPGDVTPDVLCRISAEDLQRMLGGRLDPISAYLQGNLQLEGSLQTARRLSAIVDRLG